MLKIIFLNNCNKFSTNYFEKNQMKFGLKYADFEFSTISAAYITNNKRMTNKKSLNGGSL